MTYNLISLPRKLHGKSICDGARKGRIHEQTRGEVKQAQAQKQGPENSHTWVIQNQGQREHRKGVRARKTIT